MPSKDGLSANVPSAAPMTAKQTLGSAIAFYRKRRHLNQGDLEQLVGMTTGQISRIERGEQWVTDERLDAIASALSVPVHALFMAEPDPAMQNPELCYVGERIVKLLGGLATHQKLDLLSQAENLVKQNRLVLIELGQGGKS